MNSSLRPRTTVQPGLPPAQPPADNSAAAVDGDTPACGWYESSFALRQGLAVSELSDGDARLAALWFDQLRPAALQ
jgi:hypothetical protein